MVIETIWAWITSVYAKTIGAFLMWFSKYKEQKAKEKKAEVELKKATIELRDIETNVARSESEAEFKKEADNYFNVLFPMLQGSTNVWHPRSANEVRIAAYLKGRGLIVPFGYDGFKLPYGDIGFHD